MAEMTLFWWNGLLAAGPQPALCMELTQALHAWQSWVPQNPPSAPPHCLQAVAHLEGLRTACSSEQNVAARPLKEWILPNWETVSAWLQTHTKVQWILIRHTAAYGSNQRSFLPSGNSGAFDVTNQDVKIWSSRGLWFLSVCGSALP